jgi:hypothetical protein
MSENFNRNSTETAKVSLPIICNQPFNKLCYINIQFTVRSMYALDDVF